MNFQKGERVLYRKEECEVVEVGNTYIAIRCLYTGVKSILPTKRLEYVSLSPMEISLKPVTKKKVS